MMFNDQLIGLFALLAIYMLVGDKPLSAVLFVSMALSIKAGGLLLVPTVFGWLHYFYGTTKLLQGVSVLVVF
jgi:Gpi18-like mannosyltransferase